MERLWDVNIKLTFAYIPEPNVLKSTFALAVNTFKLVHSNDDIAESGTVVENENGTFTTKIVISVTRAVKLKLLVVEVIVGTGQSSRSFEDLNSTVSGGNVEGLAEGGGGESQRSESLSEMHFRMG